MGTTLAFTTATNAAPLPARPARTLCFEDLRRILAHRFPMLMLDKVIDFEPGKYIVGTKCVTANEIHFLGHFPGVAIMPGALIIEALAQTLHVLDALSRENKPSTDRPLLKFLGGVTMRFMRPVVPGDQLRLEVDIVKQMAHGVMGNAVAKVDGYVIARGEMTLMLKEDPRGE
jgi:3-hydroxyacyl-[acyl-carrier-protein] dehydratase